MNDMGEGPDVHDTASETSAEQGVVIVDGPDGTAVTLTPRAARQTAERLASSATEAANQSEECGDERRSLPADPYALVVDDNALLLMNACDILEDAGFRFLEAGDGEQAIPLLEANWKRITLLFSDIEMPGELDGFALARHVSEHWPDIEIIVVSGRMQPEDGDLPAGATFISKPFSAQIVHDHLREKLPSGKLPGPLKNAS